MTTAEQKRRNRRDNPEQVREQDRRYRASNPEKMRAKQRRYREADPDRIRAQRLRHGYGMSLADYETMATKQNGKCAICQDPAPLIVDHCHATGAVRSLLCARCNTALGLLGDDPKRLRTAAAYIERHSRA